MQTWKLSPISSFSMRHMSVPSSLFRENRKRLTKILKPNALVVLHANDLMPTNADGLMPLQQNSDLFYLSGIQQEETVLLVYPDAKNEDERAILFIKRTNEQLAVWEGKKYTKADACAVSGIEHVCWLEDFPRLFNKLMLQAEHVYLNTNEHVRATVSVQTRDARFIGWCMEKYPLHKYERLAPLMHALRVIKAEAEIDIMRKACAITELGFKKILGLVKPGVMEYELEAELISTFICNRAQGFAYTPVIASGGKACVLHYTANDQACQSGDLVLLDVGAACANYRADVTRVIPVDGRFTRRQKDVYNAVQRVMQYAKTRLVVGNNLTSYGEEVGKAMEEELLRLELLKSEDVQNQDPKRPAYKRYFMHGASHYLGLDTHDVGDLYRPFEAGMVLTVEPGIYIPEEGLGIRLENNVVIRESGLQDLTDSIPLDTEAIEVLMHAG